MSYLEFLNEYGPRLLDGTVMTLQLMVLSSLLTIVLGFSAGLLRVSPSKILRALAMVYIELFRGTSLLVQLFWVFYVLPLFGFTLNAFTAGFVTVGLCVGAYGAELVRGGILSVPKGQWEAALALNMSPSSRMFRIILPQAIIIMLPAWGNLLIELLKGTALVALISVTDLMFEAKQINVSTFLSAQTFATALIIYFVIARFVITPGMRALEVAMNRRLGLD